MLQKIRDGASGPLAYIVVGVIAVVFGVWGIGSYFTPSSDPTVASAAGTDITQSQLQRAFDQRYQQLRQMMGDHFDSSMFPPGRIRQSVLDGLIDQAVMTQYAQDAGYRVTDANLLATLRSNPQFQDNGQFSAERYKTLLSQAGIRPAEYEARLRQSLVGGQVQQIVSAGAFAAPPEVDAAFRQAHAQRNLELLRFDPAGYRQGIDISDAAVQSYYDQHKQAFMRPARVKLAYVVLDANRLSVPQPSTKTLHSLYDEHSDTFGTPEKRSAQVIRIPISGDDDAKARATVQKLSAAAHDEPDASLKTVAQNADAADYSTIDDQSRDALPSAVGDALFQLDNGALSNPVHTDQAWYLLRMTGRTPAENPGFDDPVVQARLKAMARQQARAQAFRDRADQLSDLAYQAPNDLKTISNKLDLPIQHSQNWVSAPQGAQDSSGNDAGIGQYQAVRDAAFSDAVFKDKLNSKVLNLGDQRQVVLRVTDRQPAQERPLSALRSTIQQRLVSEAAEKKAHQAAEAALDKARSGQNLASLAKAYQAAALSNPGFVGRDADKIDPQIIAAAFSVSLDQGSDAKQDNDKSATSTNTAYDVARNSQGQSVLIAVRGERIHATGDKQQIASQREQTAQQQTQYNAALEYAALDAYLRSQADVDIHKKSLQTATQDPDGGG